MKIKKIINDEIQFIDEIIKLTKDSDYINLLARRRKARLQGELWRIENKNYKD